MRLLIAALLALALLGSSVGPIHPQAATVAFPQPPAGTASETDGRFIGLSGPGLQTLIQPSKFWIGIASGQTQLKVDVFDGDLGGLWDNHDPLNPVETQFLLYADPTKSGDPTGKSLIVSKSSKQLPDNGWGNVYAGPVHASARAASGHYFYLLVVQWSNVAIGANEFNGYKVRLEGQGQVSITPGDWAFVGAPINVGVDPAFGTAQNTYNGHWDWFMFIPPGSRSAEITECDADFRLHPNPGTPPDDELNDARVRIPPDVRYQVYRPDGQLLINNLQPSGSGLCETKTADIPSGGLFRWTWLGVDAHNLVFIRSKYEMLSIETTPLLAVAPTPSPTPTPTPTRIPPTAAPTSVPTATPTPTNPPAPPRPRRPHPRPRPGRPR